MKLIWSTTNLWQKLTHKRGYLYFKTKKYIAGATPVSSSLLPPFSSMTIYGVIKNMIYKQTDIHLVQFIDKVKTEVPLVARINVVTG